MFERFTDRARRVVVLAQEEARMLNHNYIGTEHVLLGLIHEGEGVAAKALDALGIHLEAVRQQVEEIIGQGQQAPSGHIPFTPRAKKVLELSLRESLQLGHEYIGTEHILLGLIREGEGVAATVLVRLGGDLKRVRQEVIKLVHGGQGEGEEFGPRLSSTTREFMIRDIQSVLRSIEHRLTAIERHLGMREGPAGSPEAPAAPAAPASDDPAVDTDDPPAAASDDK
jgi:ATP-dependent Clp protease ATP-binding subunit ClpC